jgi:hypothetical protein
VKEEEAPNSLLSLPKEVLQYCISFVGKGHYQFVGSICKQINIIYGNEDENMKETFWSNVAISMDLAVPARPSKTWTKKRSDTKHG